MGKVQVFSFPTGPDEVSVLLKAGFHPIAWLAGMKALSHIADGAADMSMNVAVFEDGTQPEDSATCQYLGSAYEFPTGGRILHAYNVTPQSPGGGA